MVSLKQLEIAVSAVEDISRHTIEFEIEETRFVLRALRPSEDMEVLTYVRETLENILQMDWMALKQYYFQQRLGVLSYVIVRMGDLDLTGEYLETGETMEDGTPIQVPKAQALREHMTLKWSAAMLEAVFSKYTELVMRLNERVLLKIDNEKIDDQISRLREQLSTLERLRPPPLTHQDVLQSLIQRKAERKAEKEVLAPEIKVPETTPEPPEVPRTPRREPERVQEPVDPTPPPPPRRPIYPEEVRDPRDPVQRGRMDQVADPHRGDSFLDSSDPEAAIAQENLRQLAFQRAQQQAVAEDRARAKAQRAQVTPQMTSPPLTDLATGPEEFVRPTEDLSVRQAERNPQVPAVALNPVPRSKNPRFMPRR